MMCDIIDTELFSYKKIEAMYGKEVLCVVG